MLGIQLCKTSSSVKNGCKVLIRFGCQEWTMRGLPLKQKLLPALLKMVFYHKTLDVKNSLIKFGSGKMNMPQQSRNNGVKWGFQWIILVNVLLLMKAFHKRFVKFLFNFTIKVGFTVVKNSSTGIQKR